MSDTPEAKKLPDWVATFIPIVITAALTWGGSYFTTSQSQAATQALTTYKLSQLSDQIAELRSTVTSATTQRYTSEMATLDRTAVQAQINTLINRVDKISDIESDMRQWRAGVEATLKKP